MTTVGTTGLGTLGLMLVLAGAVALAGVGTTGVGIDGTAGAVAGVGTIHGLTLAGAGAVASVGAGEAGMPGVLVSMEITFL
jgi:hypothetical protein